jgi:acetyl esterase/lipase
MKISPFKIVYFLFGFAFIFQTRGLCQDFRMPLYTGDIPNSRPNNVVERFDSIYTNALRGISIPDISVYMPTRSFSTGQAIIICPGGGYWIESVELEGRDIARYLTTIGIIAIVLKYRLPSDEICVDKHQVPLMDAQRAIRMVRANASNWGINPEKIGVMGFSAGGHLASTLATHFDYGNTNVKDSIERFSSRPNFMVLIYPVISFADSITHLGSKKQLIGKNPSPELVKYYSNELQIKDDTPPAFIIHATDDDVVWVENSLLMYRALKKKNISAELHVLSEGGHGFGLASNNNHVNFWGENLKWWLKSLQSKNKFSQF